MLPAPKWTAIFFTGPFSRETPGVHCQPPNSRATYGVAGCAAQLVERAVLRDPAVLQHDDIVGDRGDVLRVVGHQHRRAAEVAEVPRQVGAHLIPDLDVERGHRLVEHQHLGVGGERAGQRDPLRLAARQLRRMPVGQVVELEALQPGLRLVAGDGAPGTAHPRARTRCCRAR